MTVKPLHLEKPDAWEFPLTKWYHTLFNQTITLNKDEKDDGKNQTKTAPEGQS